MLHELHHDANNNMVAKEITKWLNNTFCNNMDSKWRTIIKPEKSKYDIDYSTPMFFIGSCFLIIFPKFCNEQISGFIESFCVLYNPYSIQTALRLILGEIEIDDNDLAYHNGYGTACFITAYSQTPIKISCY